MAKYEALRSHILPAKRGKALIWALCGAATVLVSITFAATGTAQTGNKQERREQVTPEVDAIEAFVEAFNARDVDSVMGFFAADAVYHNMPSAPVKGTKAIRGVIDAFVGPAEEIDWEILKIAQVGSTVLTERIDRFVIKGKPVELPVMGAFDMADGEIVAWRDYFDMATWQRQTKPD